MRRELLGAVFAAVLAVVALPTSVVFGDDAHPPAKKADDHKHDDQAGHKGTAHEEEKPDVFKGYVDLSIYTVIVFLLLLFILSRLAWKPMIDGLDKREQNIAQAIEDARIAKEEAQRLRQQFDKQIAEAHQKVADLIEEARRDAEHTREQMMAQAKSEIQAERDRLRREMDLARDQAMQEIWNLSAQLATQVSSRILPRHLNTDDQRRLVDDALANLQSFKGELQQIRASRDY